MYIYLVGLVSEEMNLLEFFVFDSSKSIGLIPTGGEDVEGNLSTDGKCQAIVRELLLQNLYECRSDFVFLVDDQSRDQVTEKVVLTKS